MSYSSLSELRRDQINSDTPQSNSGRYTFTDDNASDSDTVNLDEERIGFISDESTLSRRHRNGDTPTESSHFSDRYISFTSSSTNPRRYSRWAAKGIVILALIVVLCILIAMASSLLNLMIAPVQSTQKTNLDHRSGSVKYLESLGILPQPLQAGYVTIRALTVPNTVAANIPVNSAVIRSRAPYFTQSDVFRARYPAFTGTTPALFLDDKNSKNGDKNDTTSSNLFSSLLFDLTTHTPSHSTTVPPLADATRLYALASQSTPVPGSLLHHVHYTLAPPQRKANEADKDAVGGDATVLETPRAGRVPGVTDPVPLIIYLGHDIRLSALASALTSIMPYTLHISGEHGEIVDVDAVQSLFQGSNAWYDGDAAKHLRDQGLILAVNRRAWNKKAWVCVVELGERGYSHTEVEGRTGAAITSTDTNTNNNANGHTNTATGTGIYGSANPYHALPGALSVEEAASMLKLIINDLTDRYQLHGPVYVAAGGEWAKVAVRYARERGEEEGTRVMGSIGSGEGALSEIAKAYKDVRGAETSEKTQRARKERALGGKGGRGGRHGKNRNGKNARGVEAGADVTATDGGKSTGSSTAGKTRSDSKATGAKMKAAGGKTKVDTDSAKAVPVLADVGLDMEPKVDATKSIAELTGIDSDEQVDVEDASDSDAAADHDAGDEDEDEDGVFDHDDDDDVVSVWGEMWGVNVISVGPNPIDNTNNHDDKNNTHDNNDDKRMVHISTWHAEWQWDSESSAGEANTTIAEAIAADMSTPTANTTTTGILADAGVDTGTSGVTGDVGAPAVSMLVQDTAAHTPATPPSTTTATSPAPAAPTTPVRRSLFRRTSGSPSTSAAAFPAPPPLGGLILISPQLGPSSHAPLLSSLQQTRSLSTKALKAVQRHIRTCARVLAAEKVLKPITVTNMPVWTGDVNAGADVGTNTGAGAGANMGVGLGVGHGVMLIEEELRVATADVAAPTHITSTTSTTTTAAATGSTTLTASPVTLYSAPTASNIHRNNIVLSVMASTLRKLARGVGAYEYVALTPEWVQSVLGKRQAKKMMVEVEESVFASPVPASNITPASASTSAHTSMASASTATATAAPAPAPASPLSLSGNPYIYISIASATPARIARILLALAEAVETNIATDAATDAVAAAYESARAHALCVAEVDEEMRLAAIKAEAEAAMRAQAETQAETEAGAEGYVTSTTTTVGGETAPATLPTSSSEPASTSATVSARAPVSMPLDPYARCPALPSLPAAGAMVDKNGKNGKGGKNSVNPDLNSTPSNTTDAAETTSNSNSTATTPATIVDTAAAAPVTIPSLYLPALTFPLTTAPVLSMRLPSLPRAAVLSLLAYRRTLLSPTLAFAYARLKASICDVSTVLQRAQHTAPTDARFPAMHITLDNHGYAPYSQRQLPRLPFTSAIAARAWQQANTPTYPALHRASTFPRSALSSTAASHPLAFTSSTPLTPAVATALPHSPLTLLPARLAAKARAVATALWAEQEPSILTQSRFVPTDPALLLSLSLFPTPTPTSATSTSAPASGRGSGKGKGKGKQGSKASSLSSFSPSFSSFSASATPESAPLSLEHQITIALTPVEARAQRAISLYLSSPPVTSQLRGAAPFDANAHSGAWSMLWWAGYDAAEDVRALVEMNVKVMKAFDTVKYMHARVRKAYGRSDIAGSSNMTVSSTAAAPNTGTNTSVDTRLTPTSRLSLVSAQSSRTLATAIASLPNSGTPVGVLVLGGALDTQVCPQCADAVFTDGEWDNVNAEIEAMLMMRTKLAAAEGDGDVSEDADVKAANTSKPGKSGKVGKVDIYKEVQNEQNNDTMKDDASEVISATVSLRQRDHDSSDCDGAVAERGSRDPAVLPRKPRNRRHRSRRSRRDNDRSLAHGHDDDVVNLKSQGRLGKAGSESRVQRKKANSKASGDEKVRGGSVAAKKTVKAGVKVDVKNVKAGGKTQRQLKKLKSDSEAATADAADTADGNIDGVDKVVGATTGKGRGRRGGRGRGRGKGKAGGRRRGRGRGRGGKNNARRSRGRGRDGKGKGRGKGKAAGAATQPGLAGYGKIEPFAFSSARKGLVESGSLIRGAQNDAAKGVNTIIFMGVGGGAMGTREKGQASLFAVYRFTRGRRLRGNEEDVLPRFA